MNKYTMKILLICLTLLLVAAAQPALGSDWAQFQKDQNNSGITSDAAPTSSPSNWSVNIQAALHAAPVVGDGRVYEVDASGNVSAYNLDGSLAWKNTSIQGPGNFELATPAYGNGTLYVALSRGNYSTHAEIYALNTSDGTVRWNNTSLDNYQTNTPVKYANDRVFFGTANVNTISTTNAGNYYCFNASTGEFIWKRPSNTTSGYYWAGATVIGDYLVYGDDSGYLISVNWTDVTDHVPRTVDQTNVTNLFSFNGKIRSSICYSAENNGIYFAVNSGRTCYVGFNATTGTFSSTGNHYANYGYTSTPAVYNGRVYVGAGGWAAGAKLYCLNATNLSQTFWTYTGSTGGVQGSPAISTSLDNGNGKVYVYFTNNGPNGSLYCLEDNPGQTSAICRWTFTPDHVQYILQGPAISNGYVFFGNDGCYLYGIYESE